MWRFFRDFLIYGFASILGKLAAIFLMPIYTNILTKEEYGAMALIMSCKGIIDIVSNLNIHSGIARDYYEDGIQRTNLVSTGFFSILSLSLSILMIMLVTRNFWAYHVLGIKELFMSSFIVMLCSMPTGSLHTYFSILSRFKKKAVLYSVGTILHVVVQISLSCYGVIVLRWGVISIFLGILVAEVVSSIYFAFINREYISFTFNKEYLKRALLFSIPTLPAILAGWVDSSMGQILIGKYVSLETLGVYSIALSLSSVFTLIGGAFHNVWSPFLYENYKLPGFQKQLERLFYAVVMALSLISVSISLLSEELVTFLSNSSYVDAGKYFTLLCIPMSIYLLFPFASCGVSISRDTKYIAISYISGSVGNLVVLFVLIPQWGVISVPICLALSRIITYSVLYRVSEKKLHYQLPNYILIGFTIIIVASYFAIVLQLPFYIRLILTIIIDTLLLNYLKKKANMSFLSKLRKKIVVSQIESE